MFWECCEFLFRSFLIISTLLRMNPPRLLIAMRQVALPGPASITESFRVEGVAIALQSAMATSAQGRTVMKGFISPDYIFSFSMETISASNNS